MKKNYAAIKVLAFSLLMGSAAVCSSLQALADTSEEWDIRFICKGNLDYFLSRIGAAVFDSCYQEMTDLGIPLYRGNYTVEEDGTVTFPDNCEMGTCLSVVSSDVIYSGSILDYSDFFELDAYVLIGDELAQDLLDSQGMWLNQAAEAGIPVLITGVSEEMGIQCLELAESLGLAEVYILSSSTNAPQSLARVVRQIGKGSSCQYLNNLTSDTFPGVDDDCYLLEELEKEGISGGNYYTLQAPYTGIDSIFSSAERIISSYSNLEGTVFVYTPGYDEHVIEAETELSEMFADAGMIQIAGSVPYAEQGAFCALTLDGCNLETYVGQITAWALTDILDRTNSSERIFPRDERFVTMYPSLKATVNVGIADRLGIDYSSPQALGVDIIEEIGEHYVDVAQSEAEAKALAESEAESRAAAESEERAALESEIRASLESEIRAALESEMESRAASENASEAETEEQIEKESVAQSEKEPAEQEKDETLPEEIKPGMHF